MKATAGGARSTPADSPWQALDIQSTGTYSPALLCMAFRVTSLSPRQQRGMFALFAQEVHVPGVLLCTVLESSSAAQLPL